MTFILCPTVALRAQAAAEAVQATTPAAQANVPATKPPAAPAKPVPPPPEPIMQPVGPTSQDSSNDLSVTVGKAVVLDLARPITRIVVGLGDIAIASAVSPTQVLVDGKAPGETTLIIWDTNGGRQFFNITVRASTFASNDQLESVRRELRTELPGQPLRITEEGGNIFLRGTVNDLASSARAVSIASTAGKVVNLLDVDVPPANPQILLKVKFASVDRNKARQLGINLFSTGAGNTTGTVSTGQFSPPSVTVPTAGVPSTATVGTGTQLFAFYPGINLGATIEALETRGLVEVLAEPNIIAVNGKQASFLAGGEYPYPVAQSTGVGGAAPITIMFKEYGIRLDFIPTIMPNGVIRLQVAPEVSALDFADAVNISGFTIPAITERRVKTEVELQDGQSFAIGGLLDNNETETFQKIPFIGDIPILGKFFQSMQRNRTNTELIVIVTPEIVSPLPAGAPLPALNYPQPFMPPNSAIPMHHPDQKNAENTAATPPTTIPVEKLIDSMKPETPLSTQSTSGGGGAGGGMGSTGASTGP
ncbi:MAG: pilus assembly protein N-terminal domain-containing protein [Terracidiphilus sp.]